MRKRAVTSYPVHDLVAERWSPTVFDGRAVEPEKLGSLFEAARWAASSFNEQPWRFLVARREDAAGFERLAGCLVPANAWAKRAPVLALSVARLHFTRNGKPNRHAFHDVGLASGNLCLQAGALGLAVHMMAGFDADRARADLGIPEGHDPVAMMAIGYRGDPGAAPPELRAREEAPRSRKPLAEVAFGPGWDAPLG